MQYVQDYDELFFPMSGPTAADTWDNRIASYIPQNVMADNTNPGIFACPSDTAERFAWGGRVPRSYGLPASWNGMRNDDGTGWCRDCAKIWQQNGVPLYSLGEIPAPSNTFMLVESRSAPNFLREGWSTWVFSPVGKGFSAPDGNGWWNGRPSLDSSEPGKFLPAAHTGGYNFLFADGHAKWMRPDSSVAIGPAGALDFPRGMWTVSDKD